jgi:subtilisin family serine protease
MKRFSSLVCSTFSLVFFLFFYGFSVAFTSSSSLKAQIQETRQELILRWKPEHQQKQGTLDWLKDKPWARFVHNVKIERRFPRIKPLTEKQKNDNPKAVDLSYIETLYYESVLPQAKIIRFLQELPYFEYVEPLPKLSFFNNGYQPNDPFLQNHQTFERIHAFEAWELQKGDTNITIAIVDSEIAWDHPDLEKNIKINYNDPVNGIDDDNDGFTDNFRGWDLAGERLSENQPDNDTRSLVNFGHGTQVAGFAAATPDNQIGIAGAGFHSKILPVKVTPDSGPGNTSMGYGYDGIIYAANAGAQIINCSFGGSEFSRFGWEAVRYATYNKNTLVVAAGGNVLGDTVFYPAGFSETLAVTSLDYQDEVKTSYGCHIDIATPSGGMGLVRPNQYQNTAIGVASSWAAPIVSGAAALVKAHFPHYNALQVGEQLRIAANKEIYSVNSGEAFLNRLGNGRLDMRQALLQASPSVRLNGAHFIDGNDNIPTAGETVTWVLNLANYLEPLQALSVRLVSNTPWVEVITPTQTVGALGNMEEKVANFQIELKPNIPQNFKAYFTLIYEDATQNYRTEECFPALLNITFVNLNNEKIATTVNSVGNFGFNDININSQGVGFTWLGKNQIYLGGLVAGTSPQTTVDNLINEFGAPQRDFRPLAPLRFQQPGEIANQDVLSLFDDSGAGQNRIPLRIKNKCSIFSGNGQDQFILMEYTLTNPGAALIQNLHAGLFADWDIGDDPVNDYTRFLAQENLAYAYDEEGNTPYVGIKALQPQAAVHVSGQMNTYSNYTKTAKFRSISSGQNNANIEDNDIIQFVGVGPFEIAPQDSIVVRFALVTGRNLEELQEQGKVAEKIYCDFTRAGIQSLSLGSDTTSCRPIVIGKSFAEAVHYQWSEGSMAPQLQVWESGEYILNVYDKQGCKLSDTINVTIEPLKALFTINDTVLVPPDDLLIVEDNTPGAIEWLWDFGDGNQAHTRQAQHRYAKPDTYTLTLMVSNGNCQDTIQKVIKREVPTSVIGNLEKFPSPLTLFPNPVHNRTFHIQGLHEGETVTLYLKDISGKNVITWESVTYQDSLSLRALPLGVYFIQIVSETRNQKLKLLVGE